MVSYNDRSRCQKECCQDPNAQGFCRYTRISTWIWRMIGSLQRIQVATIRERQRKHVKKRVCKSKSHGCCQAVWHHHLLPRSCLCLWRSGVWRAIPSCTLLSCNSFLGSDSLSLLPAVRISLYFHRVSSCSRLTQASLLAWPTQYNWHPYDLRWPTSYWTCDAHHGYPQTCQFDPSALMNLTSMVLLSFIWPNLNFIVSLSSTPSINITLMPLRHFGNRHSYSYIRTSRFQRSNLFALLPLISNVPMRWFFRVLLASHRSLECCMLF